MQWHWPYFVPFNLHWYFDARCPHYSLAHRRFSHSLFKARKKKETLPVWQRLHHCLNYLKTLMKMLGLRAGILEIHIFIFTKTMWMLSVSLTTGVDSWADALKVNCERLDRGLKRQCNNLFFMAMILSSQEKLVSPNSGHLYKQKCLRIKYFFESKYLICLVQKECVLYIMWTFFQCIRKTWSFKQLFYLVCKMSKNHFHFLSWLWYQVPDNISTLWNFLWNHINIVLLLKQMILSKSNY